MSRKSNAVVCFENQPYWVQEYTESIEKQRALYKRTLIIVAISQIFGGAGLAAGITVGALLARDMLGTDSFSGVPSVLFTLGSAGAALMLGKISQRFGRRIGLAAGFMVGGIGAIGVVLAAVTNSILLLFASLLIYGAGMATNLQARYAGTDLANLNQRATAVSIAMVSTTFGAVAGPNLVEQMGRFATVMGVPSLAGPFILAAVTYILAGLVPFIFLRPDPLIVANVISKAKINEEVSMTDNRSKTMVINQRGIQTAAILMVLTQLVMVAIMTMTPVHMGKHGHGLSEVGMVIGFHIGSMYLPSLVTGILVDKVGRSFMAIASAITLLAAGILAALTPGNSLFLIIIALIFLGFGWNFGLISGTALLVDSTNPSNRAKTQGKVDVMVALSGASGGALSGLVVAQSSYAALTLGGGIISLVLIPIIMRSMKKAHLKG